MGESFGFSVTHLNQIVIFKHEQDFEEVLAANPHMTAIMGADDYTKKIYPGLYIAGVTANLPWDIEGDLCLATQK